MSIDANEVPPTIADEILDSLTEFADAIDASDDLGESLTGSRVKMISDLEANSFDRDFNTQCERGSFDEPE